MAEQGQHADLVAKGGIYANLYELQYRLERQAEEDKRQADLGKLSLAHSN